MPSNDIWTKPLTLRGVLLVIALFVAIVIGLKLYHLWLYRIPNDPDAIVEATWPYGKDSDKQRSQEDVIEGIQRYGNVNGYSPKHNCSFLYAAVRPDNQRVLDWLLANGADPNPRGENPLLSCVRGENAKVAKQLLRAGARWDVELAPGKTVLDEARKINPGLVERLQEYERARK